MKSTLGILLFVDETAYNIRPCNYANLNARALNPHSVAEVPDGSSEHNADDAHEPDVGDEIRKQHEDDAQHHRHDQRMLLAIEKGRETDHAEHERSKQSAWSWHSWFHGKSVDAGHVAL